MKTATGFEYEIDKDALNNMELIDAIGAIIEDESNIFAMSKVIGLMLGADGKKRLYDHVRTEDGRVPADRIAQEIAEIFHGEQDTKKS